jgi:hypothetical protein
VDQFDGATLTVKDHLDRNIDGITGATLSVGAVTRIARVAFVAVALPGKLRRMPGKDK